jgi:hypothetical protein
MSYIALPLRVRGMISGSHTSEMTANIIPLP